MKLNQNEIEEKEYVVFVLHNNKPRFVRFPVEVDSDTRTVTYNVVVMADISDKTPRPLDTTPPEPTDEVLELRTYEGPFFVLDKNNTKVLEVQ